MMRTPIRVPARSLLLGVMLVFAVLPIGAAGQVLGYANDGLATLLGPTALAGNSVETAGGSLGSGAPDFDLAAVLERRRAPRLLHFLLGAVAGAGVAFAVGTSYGGDDAYTTIFIGVPIGAVVGGLVGMALLE